MSLVTNYLLKLLENYFAEILAIEGKLTLSESFLKTKKDEILKENRQNKRIVNSGHVDPLFRDVDPPPCEAAIIAKS